MDYPIPKRFIKYVADKSRCSGPGGEDAVVDVALDWLREQILIERDRQDAYYEREEAKRESDDDA